MFHIEVGRRDILTNPSTGEILPADTARRGRIDDHPSISRARDRLAALAGAEVRLAAVAADKYGGRVLAAVADGGGRQSWCP
ncbi:MAG: hypothetical protein H7841_14950 [Magnetospirillum sp. WYHS-4]